MLRFPSCLSMQWTSLTRCRGTCWTWMTRQAQWLPWQRPCWLAVSPWLVLHWQVPCSSEGTVGLCYLQADLFHHIHINAAPQPRIMYIMSSVLHLSSPLLIFTTLLWALMTFHYDTIVLPRQRIHFEADKKRNGVVQRPERFPSVQSSVSFSFLSSPVKVSFSAHEKQ